MLRLFFFEKIAAGVRRVMDIELARGYNTYHILWYDG